MHMQHGIQVCGVLRKMSVILPERGVVNDGAQAGGVLVDGLDARGYARSMGQVGLDGDGST